MQFAVHPRCFMLIALLVLFPFTDVSAQDDGGSTSRGWSVAGDAVALVMRTRPVGRVKETPTGVGLRAEATYGFTNRWSAFGGLQTVSIRTGSAEGLRQVDTGLRFTFMDDNSPVRPFIEASIALRQLETRLAGSDSPFSSVRSAGGAATLGGGAQLFISPRFAVGIGLLVSSGAFRDPRIDGQRTRVLEGSVPATTLRLGLRYYLSQTSDAF